MYLQISPRYCIVYNQFLIKFSIQLINVVMKSSKILTNVYQNALIHEIVISRVDVFRLEFQQFQLISGLRFMFLAQNIVKSADFAKNFWTDIEGLL